MFLPKTNSRIEVIGQEEFNPREWLRREVLWGYLMTPYSKLYQNWVNGLSLDYYNGNVMRRELYATYAGDSEMQAMSFINHGKVIAGLLTSSIMFRAMRGGQVESSGGHIDILKLQAATVDRALHPRTSPFEPEKEVVDNIYDECIRIAGSVPFEDSHSFGNSRRLFKASSLLCRLASGEIGTWLEAASQDEHQSLPELTITDGGRPRSAGPRVDFLSPIFNQIVSSEGFNSLK